MSDECDPTSASGPTSDTGSPTRVTALPRSEGGSALVVYPLRLTPGQELYSTLMQFARDKSLRAPFVLTCCGSVTRARLRLAAQSQHNPNNTIRDYEGPFEIVSLVGTLSGAEGHLHIALSDCEGRVVGGHVIGGLEVFTTAEVVVGECSGLEFRREYDPSTGFPELVVDKRV